MISVVGRRLDTYVKCWIDKNKWGNKEYLLISKKKNSCSVTKNNPGFTEQTT